MKYLVIAFATSAVFFSLAITRQDNRKEIYKGKSFPWRVYLDHTKPLTVVEIGHIKTGYFDTMQKVEDAAGRVIARGDSSELKLLKGGKLLYTNARLKLSLKLKLQPVTQKSEAHRKTVYSYMAYWLILEMKQQDGFPEYQFDWDITADYLYHKDSLSTVKHTPEFIRKYNAAKQHLNN